MSTMIKLESLEFFGLYHREFQEKIENVVHYMDISTLVLEVIKFENV